MQENNPDRSISKKHNANERHVCVKDDLSAAAVADILRYAKEMEKLPHYYFPKIGFFFPKTETNASCFLWKQNDRSEVPRKFLNAMLEKVGEDQLDRSFEK